MKTQITFWATYGLITLLMGVWRWVFAWSYTVNIWALGVAAFCVAAIFIVIRYIIKLF